jgi:hypothetical protein
MLLYRLLLYAIGRTALVLANFSSYLPAVSSVTWKGSFPRRIAAAVLNAHLPAYSKNTYLSNFIATLFI